MPENAGDVAMSDERIAKLRAIMAECYDADRNARGLDDIQAPIEKRFKREIFEMAACNSMADALNDIERLKSSLGAAVEALEKIRAEYAFMADEACSSCNTFDDIAGAALTKIGSGSGE